MPEVESHTKLFTYESLKPDSPTYHDLLVDICQDIFGFNPDALFRENIVKEARRRFHEVKAEVATLKAMVAARDKTIRELNRYIVERERELVWLADKSVNIQAEVERLKAELEDRGVDRSSDPRIVPEFTCLD